MTNALDIALQFISGCINLISNSWLLQFVGLGVLGGCIGLLKMLLPTYRKK